MLSLTGRLLNNLVSLFLSFYFSYRINSFLVFRLFCVADVSSNKIRFRYEAKYFSLFWMYYRSYLQKVQTTLSYNVIKTISKFKFYVL